MDVSQLRCRFQFNLNPMISPAPSKFLVTNLGADKSKQIVNSQYKTITLDAGYPDGHGVVFKGTIIQGLYGRESPTDTLTTIIAGDGDHGHNFATVSATHAPGSTPQDHFNTALQALGKYGITKGYIGVDLSTPVYPRAVTLWGMARDVLQNIARSKDAMLFYDRGEVTMIPRGSSRNDATIVLNSQTGLIGMPTQTTEGIMARCLINPKIRRGSTVQIDQKDIQQSAAPLDSTGTSNAVGTSLLASVAADGLYTVISIDGSGDTRGNEWYFDMTLFAKGTVPIASSKSSWAIPET